MGSLFTLIWGDTFLALVVLHRFLFLSIFLPFVCVLWGQGRTVVNCLPLLLFSRCVSTATYCTLALLSAGLFFAGSFCTSSTILHTFDPSILRSFIPSLFFFSFIYRYIIVVVRMYVWSMSWFFNRLVISVTKSGTSVVAAIDKHSRWHVCTKNVIDT
jgi:hypothetical protein